MADWTDPSTWRDAAKFSPILTDASKAIAEAKKRGETHVALEAAETLVSILQGHQKTLMDVSQVAGKLVAYVTAAHEQKSNEVETLRHLLKSTRQLERAVEKLTKRAQKLEDRAARPRKS
jgi:hypothetical protein